MGYVSNDCSDDHNVSENCRCNCRGPGYLEPFKANNHLKSHKPGENRIAQYQVLGALHRTQLSSL